MRVLKELLGLSLAVLIISTLVGWLIWEDLNTPISPDDGEWLEIRIPSGASTMQIANALYQEGFIQETLAFRVYARLAKKDQKIQAGVYTLQRSMTPVEILEHLVSGRVVSDRVTIPEGWTLAQIRRHLVEKGMVIGEEFDQEVRDLDLLAYIDLTLPDQLRQAGAQTIEGYLFPDTYNFRRGVTAREVVVRMVRRTAEVWAAIQREIEADPVLSVHETMILASIIERETALEAEMPLVAGVFYNRLRIDMRLQSCATVAYLLDKPVDRITIADTFIDSPYNTYRVGGLPPAPIASPGKLAMKAAYQPAQTPYFFFIATPQGRHVFSRTYDEHMRAKRRIDAGEEVF